ncbi:MULTISPECIES: hypothetical protein [unclassified Methylobacterium]|jgi:hypothetical protein|uniref:hypothetical protein n=1 Tax=unclassified Methylobacterium TaxID=2615210 RepID=UPI0003675E5E|nr:MULTISPECIES: hypothetical protein [unclassified Methylobacterium]KQP41763.1 hypothetical protein ASF34_08375 [Methylobacterium sp. Leaf106]
MADAVSPLTPDLEEQLGGIRRAREASEKFVAEQKKLTAEALKLDRDRMFAPWQIALSGMAAGAAFFGAGAAFVKILGP